MTLPTLSNSLYTTTQTVASIFAEVSAVLVDKALVTHDRDELIAYFNDGLAAIAAKEPRAFFVTERLSYTTGCRQYIPAGGVRFIAVQQDATKGTSPTEVDKEYMDRNFADWLSATAETGVVAFLRDKYDQRAFYVFPGVGSTARDLDVTYLKTPTQVSYVNSAYSPTVISGVGLRFEYIPPLVSYMLARALAREDEVGSQALAAGYSQDFNNFFTTDKTFA